LRNPIPRYSYAPAKKVTNGNFAVSAKEKGTSKFLDGITITMSPDKYFLYKSGLTGSSTSGYYYDQFLVTDKLETTTPITVTANGEDRSGVYKPASDSKIINVNPNQLQISLKEPKGYAVSTATRDNTVKSCEQIVFCANITDEDGKTVLKDVDVNFKIVGDTRSDNNKKCTVAAGLRGCCMEYTAPPVEAEKTFKVEVTATAKECYKDAEKKTSDLIVKPVKLIVTSLTATPAKVKVGEKITVKATVKDDGNPAYGVKDIDVTFKIGDAIGTAVTNAAGEAMTEITAKGPVGKQKVIVNASKKPAT